MQALGEKEGDDLRKAQRTGTVDACAHCIHPQRVPSQDDPGNANSASEHTAWLATMVRTLAINPTSSIGWFLILGSDDHSIWLASLALNTPGITLLRTIGTEPPDTAAATGRLTV